MKKFIVIAVAAIACAGCSHQTQRTNLVEMGGGPKFRIEQEGPSAKAGYVFCEECTQRTPKTMRVEGPDYNPLSVGVKPALITSPSETSTVIEGTPKAKAPTHKIKRSRGHRRKGGYSGRRKVQSKYVCVKQPEAK